MKKIIHLSQELAVGRQGENPQEFWSQMTDVCLSRSQASSALIELVIDVLRKDEEIHINSHHHQNDEISENTQFFLDILKNVIRSMGMSGKIDDNRTIKVIEKIILFMSTIHPTRVDTYLPKLMKIVKEIFDSEHLFHLFLFGEGLLDLFLQKFSFSPFDPLMLDFMTNYYDKLISKPEENKNHKTKFCNVLKKMFEFLETHTRENEEKFTNQQKEAMRKVWLFYTFIMIKLLNTERSNNFFQLYLQAGNEDISYNFNEFWVFKVRNSFLDINQ